GFAGGAAGTGVLATNGLDPNAKTPTRLAWNLGTEREITSNTLITIGYVGSESYHQIANGELNTVMPQVLPGGIYFFPAGGPRKNPQLGTSRYKLTDANPSYEGLQVDFSQRQ